MTAKDDLTGRAEMAGVDKLSATITGVFHSRRRLARGSGDRSASTWRFIRSSNFHIRSPRQTVSSKEIPVGSESPRLHYDRSSTGPWVVPLLITSLSANVTTLRSPPRRRPAGGRRSQETPCALGRSRDHGIDETAVTNVINKARQPP